jgi:hypothetical protein
LADDRHRVRQHQVRIVQPKAKIHRMEGPHAVVEQRRLPRKPIEVDRRGCWHFTFANATTLCRLLLTSDQISSGFLSGNAFA